ncbi:hypothetical protein [Polymorphospora lycopeni]|uniref:Uncharacterized protein n=1 Tax=Polymorphospora lycopeni TaxID=3140240 RepID=A0ABV5CL71_9ACTN
MTATLKLTPLRVRVLRAVQRGEVLRYQGWTRTEKTKDIWKAADGSKTTVTGTCNDLANTQPRLIQPGRQLGLSIYSGRLWELTDAGEKALADHDAKEATR